MYAHIFVRSQVIYKNLNPEWNQNFDFVVEDGMHEVLLIKVWDHDMFGRVITCEFTFSKSNTDFCELVKGVSRVLIIFIHVTAPSKVLSIFFGS
jgi:hypothetical protein